MKRSHSMPFGAQILEDGSVCFRLWAPAAQSVDLHLQGDRNSLLPLKGLGRGWFELTTREASARTRYRFRINGKVEVPDPASRFQPEDVHGPSEVVDARSFDWKDDWWSGRAWEEAVIYELHVGAFTPEGTFRGVETKLDYLRELGVTAIELMPVADFPGARNWGYDGVLPYAPDSSYGRPEDLKQLVHAAHTKGLMVFLDVVYNHFGPDGNYLGLYSPQFFTDRHHTPWGDAINFDGPDSRVVRDFFIHNALYWLEEYHFDGLRLDAVHAIKDDSAPDILTELAKVVRERAGGERFVHLILENGDNAARYLKRDQETRQQLYDAQWNDDIHHALHVITSCETDGYYADYAQDPVRQLGRCLAEGFAFQGEYSEFHDAPRGEPSSELPPSAFVSFLQNHDQIGNRAFGERISQIARPGVLKAAMEILLLAPQPPLLFMGEEFAAASPFLFFCDFEGGLAEAVTNGRRNEFAHFARFSSAETRDQIPDPNGEQTFLRSKLDWASVTKDLHAQWLRFYRELLSLRQRVIVPRLRKMHGPRTKFWVCQSRGLRVEWRLSDGSQLELHANLGDDWITTKAGASKGQFYFSNSECSKAFEQRVLPPWSVVWSLHE
ncbi:MAG TPA: malto-oligosyltrehalose trehalohydrolase [Terriglobales bacterium]|nr:malto-oligosyltrehalose trehalohydrolase [Terriglobales bacterium]